MTAKEDFLSFVTSAYCYQKRLRATWVQFITSEKCHLPCDFNSDSMFGSSFEFLSTVTFEHKDLHQVLAPPGSSGSLALCCS